jgi:hypothetical protein
LLWLDLLHSQVLGYFTATFFDHLTDRLTSAAFDTTYQSIAFAWHFSHSFFNRTTARQSLG